LTYTHFYTQLHPLINKFSYQLTSSEGFQPLPTVLSYLIEIPEEFNKSPYFS
jgi:hypothetical protein